MDQEIKFDTIHVSFKVKVMFVVEVVVAVVEYVDNLLPKQDELLHRYN